MLGNKNQAARQKEADLALLSHAEHGDLDGVLGALGSGADIEAADPSGWTAAMWAAGHGHESCLRALISAGANIEALDIGKKNAVMISAAYGHETTLRILIEAGADVHGVNGLGWSAAAGASYHGQIGCLLALMEAGADIDTHDGHGRTPASLAASRRHAAVAALLEGAILKGALQKRHEAEALRKGDESSSLDGATPGRRVRI